MRTLQKLAALGGALSLAACATTPTTFVPTTPNSHEYGRRITYSYGAAQAAEAERCAPIDLAVLDIGASRTDNPVEQAADAFIEQQHIVCRMSAFNSEEAVRGSLLIAEFNPVAAGSGYLRLGHQQNTGPGTAFWIAAEGAAALAEETGSEPWQDRFECRQPYNFVEAPSGRYEMTVGDIRCLPVLSSRTDLTVPPIPAPVGRDGLRGLQQPNRTEDLITQ